MIEIALLAQQAMTLLGPVASAAATKVADQLTDKCITESGTKLLNWLTAKFKGTESASVLDRAVAEPENPRRLEALRLEIEDLAEKDAEFREQLAGLLKEIAGETVIVTAPQTLTQTGDNNKGAQAAGKDISIKIG
jgi:hypothetical protein